MFAQYVVKPTFFEIQDVSNDGVVSGYENQAGPYSLWNPEENTFVEIGGAEPAQGVGGAVRFSAYFHHQPILSQRFLQFGKKITNY